MATVTSKVITEIGSGLYRAHSSGSTTIAVSYASTWNWQLKEVRLHLSTGIAEGSTFTVTINSSDGVVHDINLVSQDMSSVSDVHYQPTRPVELSAGDTVDTAWTNNTTSKWGQSIIFSKNL